MKLILLFIIFTYYTANSQPQDANYQISSNTPRGSYSNQIGYEEVIMFKPDKPGKLEKIFVFLSGDKPGKDTLRVVGDPTDNYLAPTYWVHGMYANYNLYTEFIVDYDGNPGWYEFDVSDLKLDVGGINRIGVAHIIKQNGFHFLFDNDYAAYPYGNWINDVFTPNPDFYNIRGSKFSLAQGDYISALKVNWTGKDESFGKQLLDVSVDAGLYSMDKPITDAMGSIVDFNNDDLDDINIGGKYFQNNGDGTFTDVSERFKDVISGKNIWADIDNDGYIDIFVSRGNNEDVIFYGKEDGSFEEDTDPIFFKNEPTTSPLFVDYNNDGLLDIFIARGRTTIDGKEVYYQDELYENQGNRKFKNVTAPSKIIDGEPMGNYDCWGASVCDFNNDNLPDIFVATYRLAPDLLFKNNGDNTFDEIGASSSVRGNPTQNPNYFGHGMGSDWGDINLDGYDDLVVGNLGHPDERGIVSNPSLMFINKGNKTFQEVSGIKGLKFFEMNAGVKWVDLNSDGYLDLWSCQYAYYKKGNNNLPDKNSRVYLNSASDNDLEDFIFEDKTEEYGSLIHGAWTPLSIDYNLDGYQDLLICSNQDMIKLYSNSLVERGKFLNIKVSGDGEKVNRDAYGTTITVETDNKTIKRSIMGTQSTGRVSQSSNTFNFGLGDDTKINNVSIKFSDGKELSNFYAFEINTNYKINYDGNLKELNQPEVYFLDDINVFSRNTDFKVFAKAQYNVEETEFNLYDESNNIIYSEILLDNKFESPILNFPNKMKLFAEFVFKNKSQSKGIKSDKYEIIIDDIQSVLDIDKSFSGVYPSITNNTFNISFDELSTDIANIKIIDINGNILRRIVRNISNSDTIEISVNDFATGKYFVEVILNNRINNHDIIKE